MAVKRKGQNDDGRNGKEESEPDKTRYRHQALGFF